MTKEEWVKKYGKRSYWEFLKLCENKYLTTDLIARKFKVTKRTVEMWIKFL